MHEISKWARRILISEIVLVTCAVLLTIFLPYRLQTRAVMTLLLFTGVISLVRYIGAQTSFNQFFPRLGRLGIHYEVFPEAFFNASWIIMVALGVAGILALIGWMFGTLNSYGLAHRAMTYPVSTLIQQGIMQLYVCRRLLLVTKERSALAWSAGIFALVHLPNPALMLATLPSGYALSYNYARHRCFYAVWFAHLLFGSAFSLSFSQTFTGAMRVGLGYLKWIGIA